MIPSFRLPYRASLAAVALLLLGGCLAESAGEDDVADDGEDALAQASCVVTYNVVSQSSGLFQADITLRNQSGKPYQGWKMGFAFPGGQRAQSFSGVKGSQSGSLVTVSNGSTNGAVASNASVSFGLAGSYGTTNKAPTEFTVNGARCSLGGLTTSGGGGTGGAKAGSGSSGQGGP